MEQRYDYIRVINKSGRPHPKDSYRLGWLDSMRGLALISMIFYHYMWDVVYLYGEDFSWYDSLLGYVWQQSICWSFILISGFTCRIGKHTIRRGLIIFIVGAVISLFTILAMPDIAIRFGILTLIGSAILFTGILNIVLRKTPVALGLIISAFLFFITRNVNGGYLGFYGLNMVELPQWLYRGYFTTFLGFPAPGFVSTDYFSFIPWIFLFWCGYYIYGIYDKISDADIAGAVINIPVISFLGRHSLIIYVIHQPVIYLILDLIYRFK